MAYIWTNYSPERRYALSGRHISPYMEVWDSGMDPIPVNIFYRLHSLLLPEGSFRDKAAREYEVSELLLNYMGEGADQRYPEIANVVIHYIAQLDRLRGLRLEEVVDALLEEDIRGGVYGDWARDTFQDVFQADGLDQEYRRAFLRCLTKYTLGIQRENVFDTALYALFSDTRLYFEKSTETLHIYLGDEHTPKAEKRYRLCEFFFQDLLLCTSVMWKGGHFGVIGWDESMVLDRTALI